MYENSPIFHAKNIEAPVYLMVGKVDLRVPPSQGHEFYHHLKALGKEVSYSVYRFSYYSGDYSGDLNYSI